MVLALSKSLINSHSLVSLCLGCSIKFVLDISGLVSSQKSFSNPNPLLEISFLSACFFFFFLLTNVPVVLLTKCYFTTSPPPPPLASQSFLLEVSVMCLLAACRQLFSPPLMVSLSVAKSFGFLKCI